MKTMNGIKLEIQEHWNHYRPDASGNLHAQASSGYDPFSNDLTMWMVFEKPIPIVIDEYLNNHLLFMFIMEANEKACRICGNLNCRWNCEEIYSSYLQGN